MIKTNEEKYFSAVDSREEALIDLSQRIWNYAEPGLREVESSKAIAAYLESEGFRVQLGVGVNAQLREALSTFIAVDYEQGLRDSRSRSVSGRIGLQYVW